MSNKTTFHLFLIPLYSLNVLFVTLIYNAFTISWFLNVFLCFKWGNFLTADTDRNEHRHMAIHTQEDLQSVLLTVLSELRTLCGRKGSRGREALAQMPKPLGSLRGYLVGLGRNANTKLLLLQYLLMLITEHVHRCTVLIWWVLQNRLCCAA